MSEDETTPRDVTVTFDVVGFDDWGAKWKVSNGDAGFVRVLDLIMALFVVVDVFKDLFSFVFVPTSLLGEGDREDDWDLGFVGGSLEVRGKE